MNVRPWLKSYPPGARWDMPIEFCPVQSILDTAAERFGPLPALQFMDRRISYAELEALANRAAAGFQKLGVGPGVHVAPLSAQYAPLPDRLLRRAEGGRSCRQCLPARVDARAGVQDRGQRIRHSRDPRSRLALSAGREAPGLHTTQEAHRRRIRRMGARAGPGQGAYEGRRNAERAEVRRTHSRVPRSHRQRRPLIRPTRSAT